MTNSQLSTLRKLAEVEKDAEYITISMQPAAILELIGTLERAVEVIQYYADEDEKCTIVYDKRAKEFLASLEGGEK